VVLSGKVSAMTTVVAPVFGAKQQQPCGVLYAADRSAAASNCGFCRSRATESTPLITCSSCGNGGESTFHPPSFFLASCFVCCSRVPAPSSHQQTRPGSVHLQLAVWRHTKWSNLRQLQIERPRGASFLSQLQFIYRGAPVYGASAYSSRVVRLPPQSTSDSKRPPERAGVAVPL
jgi:hypothetical protein